MFGAILLFIGLAAILVSMGMITGAAKKIKYYTCVAILLFCSMWCNIIGGILLQEFNYKQGQIDAITGLEQYYRSQNPDGTVVWIKRDETTIKTLRLERKDKNKHIVEEIK